MEVKKYGKLNPEEKIWAEAIIELYTRRADISLSDFSIISVKLNVVDFPILKNNCFVVQESEKFGIKLSFYF